MKRIAFPVLLYFLLFCLLMGFTRAEGEQTGPTGEATGTGSEQVETQQPQKPSVTWGDYKYIFTSAEPSDDVDPQSILIYEHSPARGNSTWSGANYVHLYITIEWLQNSPLSKTASIDDPRITYQYPDYMPLQIVLRSGSRSYILYGKNCSNSSYLWRSVNRYPSLVGGKAKVIFTIDTNGAAIDPNIAYLSISGMAEIFDIEKLGDLYAFENTKDYGRSGTSYHTYTHLTDIPISQITSP
jgi:hypothetical protein